MFTAIIVTSCGSGDETNPGLCFWVDAMLHTVLPLTRPIDVTRATYLCLLMSRTCYGINFCKFILHVCMVCCLVSYTCACDADRQITCQGRMQVFGEGGGPT